MLRFARYAWPAFLWLPTWPVLALDAEDLQAQHMQALSEAAPDFVLRNASGETLHLSDLRGHAVILHFWATWCKPCREELPALHTMASRLGDDDVKLVAVAIDEKLDAASFRRYVRDLGVTFPVYLAREGSITDRYWSWGVPVTYLIDSEGQLVARALGPQDWASASMHTLITQLAVSPASGFP